MTKLTAYNLTQFLSFFFNKTLFKTFFITTSIVICKVKKRTNLIMPEYSKCVPEHFIALNYF